MNETTRDAARSADVVVFVTDVPDLGAKTSETSNEAPLGVHPSDVTLLADIGRDRPTVLVVNKVDRVRDKKKLLPLVSAFAKLRDFAAILPVSARRRDGLDVVLDEVAKLCPEASWQFGVDDMTDRPTRFFAGEYIREQILRATAAEVPHSVAVTIDRFVEPAGNLSSPSADGSVSDAGPKRPPLAVHIDATIHVERNGQKRILIGTGGAMLKAIGTEARLRIEASGSEGQSQALGSRGPSMASVYALAGRAWVRSSFVGGHDGECSGRSCTRSKTLRSRRLTMRLPRVTRASNDDRRARHRGAIGAQAKDFPRRARRPAERWEKHAL